MLVSIDDAKMNFSSIINQALKGEEVIVTKDNVPLIRLIPYTEEVEVRRGGQLKGLIKISEDFDLPLPDEILKEFIVL